MKTLFKVLVLGILLTAFSALTFAQDANELATLFEKFKTEAKAPCGQRDAAMATGKTIIEKFGADELNKDVIDYVKKKMADFEKTEPRCKLIESYNASYRAKDWNKFMSLSKELLAQESNTPLGLDIALTMVSVGYDQAVAKVDTYNNDTLNYAKQAIQKIEGGTGSQTGNFGTYNGFKTKTFPDGKNNSLNWMNYVLGYVNFYRLGATDPAKKKEALPYFYKVTQIPGENQKEISLYTNIGNWYFDQAAELDKKYRDLRAANNNTDTDESKAVLGMARGYADRAIDSFARARKVAQENKATPKVLEAISKTLTDLYKFRFNIAPDAKTPDLENYVSGLLTKPMPDPATDITPVVEEVKPTPTTTTGTTPPTTTPSTTTTTPKPTTTTKQPTTTNVKQPTSSTTTNSTTEATTATTTKPKTTVKKPVTKKKGTR